MPFSGVYWEYAAIRIEWPCAVLHLAQVAPVKARQKTCLVLKIGEILPLLGFDSSSSFVHAISHDPIGILG